MLFRILVVATYLAVANVGVAATDALLSTPSESPPTPPADRTAAGGKGGKMMMMGMKKKKKAKGKGAVKENEKINKTPLKEHLGLLKLQILESIEAKKEIGIGATYLRLAFHDCVPEAGCDGCVNLDIGENNGLEPAVDALDDIVNKFENEALNVTRADIWAFAALVAVEDAQTTLVFTDEFKVGRKTCETTNNCSNPCAAKSGPEKPVDFPLPSFTTHELIVFMHKRFGYSADDTVAIMGAHTLGKATRNHTGFNGQWVVNNAVLDNEYYTQVVAPNWIQKTDTLTPQRFPPQQWIREGEEEDFTLDEGGLMMLNADIALVRNLNGSLNEVAQAECVLRCPLAETFSKAEVYRNNNDVWLSDFKKVLNVMIENV